MLAHKERTLLLSGLVLALLGMSAWIIYSTVKTAGNTYTSGAPPQDVQSMILPQTIPLAQMRPPALSVTDEVRFGSATSVASIVEFGDYQCADCKMLNAAITNVLPKYHGQVRFVWRDLPIEDKHPLALDAAVFATCAGKQGAFWEAHDALLATDQLSAFAFSQISQSLHLDQTAMDECRANPIIAANIRTNVQLAQSDGVSGAPLVFIGTEAHYGTMTEDEIDQALKKFIGN